MNDLIFARRDSPLALHGLLAAQVKSYHTHYHLGENSSVSQAVAQGLLQSIQYTLSLAGPEGDIHTALVRGQDMLKEKLASAQTLYRLLSATDQPSQCRWETLHTLGRYLQRYDLLHFAHQTPELLFYPLGVQIPQGLPGIDRTIFYLNCLWLEDQILECFDGAALGELQARQTEEAPQNICEQPLWNALGRRMLGLSLDTLHLDGCQLQALAQCYSPARFRAAVEDVCKTLALLPHPAAYARAILMELEPRLQAALPSGSLRGLFF